MSYVVLNLMQLDVEVSPPAFGWNLDKQCVLYRDSRRDEIPGEGEGRSAGFCIEPRYAAHCQANDFWSSDFWSSLKFWSSYRQKVVHKSPPCIRTGGLKKSKLMIMSGCIFVKYHDM